MPVEVIGVSGAPRSSEPLVTAMSTTRLAPVPVWVMSKSPPSDTPATVRLTPVPVISRKGPAGTSRSTVVVPTVSESTTWVLVVLSATVKVPPRVTPGPDGHRAGQAPGQTRGVEPEGTGAAGEGDEGGGPVAEACGDVGEADLATVRPEPVALTTKGHVAAEGLPAHGHGDAGALDPQ